MKVLVGWDNVEQAELISLYLNVDGTDAFIATSGGELLAQAEGGDWQAILLAIGLGSLEENFALFQALRKRLPDTPIVGVCDAQDIYRVARYLTAGMRSYVFRDDRGDFVFLLQVTVANVVRTVEAEREQKIAERLREEVESVRKLQESIIPSSICSPDGYAIAARYETSQLRVLGGVPVVLAGGDYYNVFQLDDHHIVFLVGDASGHGMKACMSIMTMHTLMQMLRLDNYQEPGLFVEEVNRRLCDQSIVSNEGGFITLLYGVLDCTTHEFRWATAGHPLPVVQNLTTSEVTCLSGEDAAGYPLGIDATAQYESYTSALPEHHRLLLYTDGLTEAFRNGSGPHKEFGQKGLSETLSRCSNLPLPAAMQSLFDATHAFTEGAGRHDDTTVVFVERM